MNFEPQPQTSTYVTYEFVPPEIICEIDKYLSFEDSRNFQISDDASDCYLMCTNRCSMKCGFSEINLEEILTRCEEVKEVVIIIKEIRSLQKSTENPQLLKETSLYHKDGYLGHFLTRVQPSQLSKLRLISVHVDIMRESFSELWFPCPIEDLQYSIRNLAEAQFETFIQISFCSTNLHDDDFHLRNLLISGMEMALKQAEKDGAKTEFTFDPPEGFVDMNAVKGRVEYSFSFFYYNPEICELPSDEDSVMESENILAWKVNF